MSYHIFMTNTDFRSSNSVARRSLWSATRYPVERAIAIASNTEFASFFSNPPKTQVEIDSEYLAATSYRAGLISQLELLGGWTDALESAAEADSIL